MRKAIAGFGLVVTAVAACGEAPTAPPVAGLQMAAFTETFSEHVPLEDEATVLVPCAAGGAGELVAISGALHFSTHRTVTPNGGVTEKTHLNPTGVKGIGLTTGVKYQGTGVTQEVLRLHSASTTTFVSNFRIIGQGAGNNLLAHTVVHVTVTPTGKVTLLEHASIDCK